MSFEPIYKSLGKRTDQLEQLVRVTASPDPEELRAAYSRIEELEGVIAALSTDLLYMQLGVHPANMVAVAESALEKIEKVL